MERARETWDAISGHVYRHAPGAAAAVAEIRQRSWRAPTTEEARRNLLAAYLDLDLANPGHADKVKGLARLLAADPSPQGAPGALAELSDARREKLIHAFKVVGDERLLRRIAEMPAAEALHAVATATGILRGHRACRWLESMGYPLVAPDSLIQRFFQRLGWLQADETGRKRMPEQVVGAMLELASCGAPVREVAFVIRAFCGGENGLAPVASPCADEPNCSECPANSFCRTGSGRSDRAELPHDADISGAAVHSRRGEMRQLADNDLLELIARAASRTDAERASLTGAVASQSVRRGDLRHAELMALPSVSDAGALALCAAAELARRAQSEDGDRAAPLSEARLVFERYRRDFKNLQHEEVHVISTDIKHRPLRDNLVSRGGLAESLANPREIFRDAVRDAAYGIIAVHNHPSGDPSPSRKDVLLTVRLARAGSLLGIHLIDHVIVGSRSYFSFEESGLLAQLLPEGDHE